MSGTITRSKRQGMQATQTVPTTIDPQVQQQSSTRTAPGTGTASLSQDQVVVSTEAATGDGIEPSPQNLTAVTEMRTSGPTQGDESQPATVHTPRHQNTSPLTPTDSPLNEQSQPQKDDANVTARGRVTTPPNEPELSTTGTNDEIPIAFSLNDDR